VLERARTLLDASSSASGGARASCLAVADPNPNDALTLEYETVKNTIRVDLVYSVLRWVHVTRPSLCCFLTHGHAYVCVHDHGRYIGTSNEDRVQFEFRAIVDAITSYFGGWFAMHNGIGNSKFKEMFSEWRMNSFYLENAALAAHVRRYASESTRSRDVTVADYMYMAIPRYLVAGFAPDGAEALEAAGRESSPARARSFKTREFRLLGRAECTRCVAAVYTRISDYLGTLDVVIDMLVALVNHMRSRIRATCVSFSEHHVEWRAIDAKEADTVLAEFEAVFGACVHFGKPHVMSSRQYVGWLVGRSVGHSCTAWSARRGG